MQDSGPPHGRQLLPETTRPPATIGPELCVAGLTCVVQDLRLPDHLAGLGVQREGVVVVAVVQDQTVVDRDVAVVLRVEAHLGVEVAGQLPRVAPDEVPGHGVHGLDHVVDRGNVEHAVIRQGRDLGRPHADFASPDQAQPLHVRPVDLVQGAVAPTVQRAAEHQPLRRRRVLKHLVRDRHERRCRILGRQSGAEPDAQGKGHNHQPAFERARNLRGRNWVRRRPRRLPRGNAPRSGDHTAAQTPSTRHCSASVYSPSSGQGGDCSSRNGADSGSADVSPAPASEVTSSTIGSRHRDLH